jgi:mannitol/fructose-specific phosphotransferase system IIA component (Ntr-type)
MTPPVADAPRFSEYLGPRGCWILDGPAGGGVRDKWEAITRMVDLMIDAGRVAKEQRDAVLTLLLEREKSMSTGLECGIALPHAAVDGLPQLVASIAVFRQGVPFQSIDGGPARIVVLLLIPKEKRMAYLPVLAEAARLLSRDSVREQLLAAAASNPPGPADLLPIIRAAEGSADTRRP